MSDPVCSVCSKGEQQQCASKQLREKNKLKGERENPYFP